jgi:hypothetical protein
MGKTLLTGSSTNGGVTTQNTSSNFFQLSNGWFVRRATESDQQILFRSTGTLSKLYVRVITNTNVNAITFTIRKNGANGNLNLSIGAGVTGTFEDSTNTDTVAAGDKLNYQSTNGGATGTMTYNLISVIFNATTNYVSKVVCDGVGVAGASTTNYWQPTGQVSGVTAGESNVQHRVKKAGTLKNLCAHVSVNPRTSDTVVTVKLNGSSTSITTTIGASTTGFFEDTTHSASIAVDDLINTMTVTGAGTGNMILDNIMLEYETSTRHGFIDAGALGSSAELVATANTTSYYVPSGETSAQASEADAKLKTRIPLTLSNLTISLRLNTVSAASTFKTRVNGTDGNQTITISSNTTGHFHDTTNTDVVDDNDEINYQLITGATGTSMTVRQMSVWSLSYIDITKTASDTKTISENIARLKSTPKSIIETQTISAGTVARINAALKALSQTSTLSDGVVRAIVHVTGAIVKTLSQTTVISEAAARLKAVWRLQP